MGRGDTGRPESWEANYGFAFAMRTSESGRRDFRVHSLNPNTNKVMLAANSQCLQLFSSGPRQTRGMRHGVSGGIDTGRNAEERRQRRPAVGGSCTCRIRGRNHRKMPEPAHRGRIRDHWLGRNTRRLKGDLEEHWDLWKSAS